MLIIAFCILHVEQRYKLQVLQLHLFQILPIMKFARDFVINNPLCVCSEEIALIKKDLIDEKDKLKLKQETSQILLRIVQERYFMNLKIMVPDTYPLKQVE